jgi:hypothetical protein
MNRIVLLLAFCTAAANAGPTALRAVDTRTTDVAGRRYFGRVGSYALIADGESDAGTPVTLAPDRPTYIVFAQRPGSESRVAAVASVLLQDGRVLLMQLDELQAHQVRLIGCELLRLPDEPIPVARTQPGPAPRAVRPDTLIQRLVGLVSPDSIRASVRRMVDFRTRYTYTDSCRSAERHYADYFAGLGLDSVALDSYVVQGDTFRNVVGMMRGSTNPERLVIVCGHMDCESESHDIYAPGAEDNASGTAMAVEAARILAGERFGASVMFVLFTGEEQGLWGSFFFVQKLMLAGRPVVGALNFDMIAWPGGEFGVALHCDSLSQPLADFEARLADVYTTLDHSVDQQQYGSDQLAFMYFGYPATAGAEYGGFYPWYHTTADTIGNCDFSLAAEVAKMAIATAVSLADAPAQPGSFTLRDAGIGSTLTAAWQPSPSPRIAGYKLLWGTAPLAYTDSVLLGNVQQHDLTGLANGTRYYATCVAVDSAGREGFPAPEQSAVPNSVPLAPTDFAVIPVSWANQLGWRPNQELDLAGYNVYRSTLPGSGFARLNSTLVTDTAYRDPGLQSDTMYHYFVTAVDTQQNESDSSVIGRAKPITLDHGILLVDATRDWGGTPGRPSDAQQDSFYHACLAGTRYTDWDCAALGEVPLAGDVGPYSTIVWHADDATALRIRNALPGLANYLAQGGRLWYSGSKPLVGILPPNPVFPVTFAPGTFGYDRLHLDQGSESNAADLTGATGRLGYPDVTCDSAKMFPSQHGRWSGTDITYPRDAECIYTFNSFSGDTFQDKPVGVRWLGTPGRVVCLGFPLYYMHDAEARPVAVRILTDLGEPIAVQEKPDSEVPPPDCIPAVIRGMLNLPLSPLAAPCYLLAADGRRVLELRPGPNDIRRLAPGVYFLRQAARSTKLVVAR